MMNQHMDTQAKEILAFWFGTADFTRGLERRKAWLIKDPVFDEEIRSRFLAIYEKTAQGTLQSC